MLFVLKIRQNTSNHGWVNNDLGKPAIRMLQANMSSSAVTKITKRYPDDHLFDWTKMSWCQTESVTETSPCAIGNFCK